MDGDLSVRRPEFKVECLNDELEKLRVKGVDMLPLLLFVVRSYNTRTKPCHTCRPLMIHKLVIIYTIITSSF